MYSLPSPLAIENENNDNSLSGSSTVGELSGESENNESLDSEGDFEYDTPASDVDVAENKRRERIQRIGLKEALTIRHIENKDLTREGEEKVSDTEPTSYPPGECECRTPSPNRYGPEYSCTLPLKYRYAQSESSRRRYETRRSRRNALQEETFKGFSYRRARAERRRVDTTQPELGREERERSRTPDLTDDSTDEFFDRDYYDL